MLGATKKIVGADAGVRIFSVVTKSIGGVNIGMRIFQCSDEEDWGCECWGAYILMQ